MRDVPTLLLREVGSIPGRLARFYRGFAEPKQHKRKFVARKGGEMKEMFWKHKADEKVFADGWVAGYDSNGDLVQVFIIHKEIKEPDLVRKVMEKDIWNFTDDPEFFPIAARVEMGDAIYKNINTDYYSEAAPYFR